MDHERRDADLTLSSPYFTLLVAIRRNQQSSSLGPIGGRELTELSDGAGNGFESESNVGRRSVAAETEADGSTGFFRRQTDGGEHVGRFDGARRAGGAGGASEALQVEGDDEGFAFDAGKGDVRGVGSARCRGGVGTSVRNSCQQAAFEFVSQQGDARGVFFECSARELGGFTEADNAGDIFRTGPEATLMMAAVEKLAQTRAATNVESADTLGCVELVAGDREQIDAEAADVDRYLSCGLHGVRVEVDVVLRGDLADLHKRLD